MWPGVGVPFPSVGVVRSGGRGRARSGGRRSHLVKQFAQDRRPLQPPRQAKARRERRRDRGCQIRPL
uniref:Uncharacterized protein n=1 Tax=Oryza glumipatula TaxID=40148 RepID=A0A0E0AHS9_9ORYZ